jgi:hypothetical protein
MKIALGVVVALVLIVAVLAWWAFRTSPLVADFERDRAALVERASARAKADARGPIHEQDLAPLPPLVQKWLKRVGVVGKPHVHSVRLELDGRIRNGEDAPWMPFHATQVSSFDDELTRLFLMKGTLMGVPWTGYHHYIGPDAVMDIRAANLVSMVEAHGKEMNQSETVTIFNDVCFLAPGFVVDAGIRWEPVDDHHMKGSFVRGPFTVSAIFTFNDDGDLVDWRSEDRIQSADGKTFKQLPWSTPVKTFGHFGGLRLLKSGDARWTENGKEFVYVEMDVVDVETNPSR